MTVCSGAQGALASLPVLEKTRNQREQEQTVDMILIQTLVIVETLISP